MAVACAEQNAGSTPATPYRTQFRVFTNGRETMLAMAAPFIGITAFLIVYGVLDALDPINRINDEEQYDEQT